jgi:hypothetical protein
MERWLGVDGVSRCVLFAHALLAGGVDGVEIHSCIRAILRAEHGEVFVRTKQQVIDGDMVGYGISMQVLVSVDAAAEAVHDSLSCLAERVPGIVYCEVLNTNPFARWP